MKNFNPLQSSTAFERIILPYYYTDTVDKYGVQRTALSSIMPQIVDLSDYQEIMRMCIYSQTDEMFPTESVVERLQTDILILTSIYLRHQKIRYQRFFEPERSEKLSLMALVKEHAGKDRPFYYRNILSSMKQLPDWLCSVFQIPQNVEDRSYAICTPYPKLIFALINKVGSAPFSKEIKTRHSYQYNAKFYEDIITAISSEDEPEIALEQLYILERLFGLYARSRLLIKSQDKKWFSRIGTFSGEDSSHLLQQLNMLLWPQPYVFSRTDILLSSAEEWQRKEDYECYLKHSASHLRHAFPKMLLAFYSCLKIMFNSDGEKMHAFVKDQLTSTDQLIVEHYKLPTINKSRTAAEYYLEHVHECDLVLPLQHSTDTWGKFKQRDGKYPMHWDYGKYY